MHAATGGRKASAGLGGQAAGMLTEQLGTRLAEALLRLRAYAYAHDRGLSDVAGDIVARRLYLSADLDLAADGDA
ncbi:MAG TPA: ANTAR domain-containing protein [Streptosporangiaceae bacterium]